MTSTFPDAPDDFSGVGVTHGDVTDALTAVEVFILEGGATGPAGPKGDAGADGTNGADGIDGANGADGAPGADATVDPTADLTVTGTWDYTSTAPYVGDYIDIIGYDPSTGEPNPNSGIRYSVNQAHHADLFLVGHYASHDVDAELTGVSAVTVDELDYAGTSDSDLATTTFNIIIPTAGATGELPDVLPTPASDVIAAFNASVASGRVTASLTPGHDGTGNAYLANAELLFSSGSITPHVQIREGVITSPVTIHPDEVHETPLTLRPAPGSSLGVAVLNIEHYDGTPNDGNGYGVIHLDSDGGGGLAGGRLTWSQYGDLWVDADTTTLGGQAPFRVGASIGLGSDHAALAIGARSAEQVGWELYPYTDSTADSIVAYDPNDGTTKRFRVLPNGEAHAMGGLVLTSPDGTQYRVNVADDGTLTTEPA